MSSLSFVPVEAATVVRYFPCWSTPHKYFSLAHTPQITILPNDNILSAFFYLLGQRFVQSTRHEDISLRIPSTQFYTKLGLDGWEGVQRWVRETELHDSNWHTADLVFVPIFWGPHGVDSKRHVGFATGTIGRDVCLFLYDRKNERGFRQIVQK